MKKYFIKKGVLLVFFMGLFFSVNAQKMLIGGPVAVTITGDANVYVNDTKTYTASASGVTIFSGNWSVLGGTILSQNATSATIQWTSSGGKLLEYDATSSTTGFMEGAILIMVNASSGPGTPSNPTISNQNCTSATLQRSTTPPSGVIWYWQGTNSSGTSTSNSNSTYSVNSSGTYYLRARNSSGIWSTGSSSILITLGTTGGTTWYADTDGDLLGDPIITLVQCVQPSGYVSNGDDLCPTQDGQGNSNGCPSGTSAFGNENYVYTIVPQKATTSIATLTQDGDKIASITYFDGLGRAKQSIGIKQSPLKKDIVTHIEYDYFGRQVKDYLPYTATTNNGHLKADALSATKTYYKTHYADDFVGVDTININPYSEKGFENSPLNKIVEQTAPGNAWKISTTMLTGKNYSDANSIKFEYAKNSSNEVKMYKATTTFANNTYTPTLVLDTGANNGNYLASQLHKTITKDENWKLVDGLNHTTEEFKNKQGQVVLKRTYNNTINHDTYYVYDAYGNLTYVLPPKGSAATSGITTSVLNELCYQYKYDYRNRLVEKRIPGKGWEYIVYDKLDRPIITSDANQASTAKWLFTKYDVLGRVAYTGVKKGYTNRLALQTSANNTASQYVTKVLGSPSTSWSTNSGTLLFYNNNSYSTPIANSELYTINYYDIYTDLPTGLSSTVTTSFGVSSTTRTKGLPTVSKVRVLDTNNWITTVTYYDEKARPIYVYSKNDYLQTTDILENKLDDFTDRVLETKTTHTKADDTISGTITTTDEFEYDYTGRLLQQTQSGTGRTGTEVIAQNTYDELGQLETKSVGGKTTQTRLQDIDYNYNVRGWLTNINHDANNDNDLFNFTLQYNNPTSGTALFNGNISQTSWNTLNTDSNIKTYTYSYDALNRITDAVSNNGRYDLNNVSYDKNGNIQTLLRKGHIVDNPIASNNAHFNTMDNLVYTYDSGNKLLKVTDTGLAPVGIKGQFQDGNTSGNDYTYDANGNMKTDANKNIGNITYNHLNLPTSVGVDWNTITYVYDATGVKLSKIVNSYPTATITEYAGNYIYKKTGSGAKMLQFFNHPEGYVQNTNGVFSYVYQYKDHLGNVRLSYADSNNDGDIDVTTNPNTNELVEESNYYPFGLEHKGYNSAISSNGNSTAQKFGFGGKELSEELGLNTMDFGARNYDASIGRWFNVDPLAEKGKMLSPYQYSFNNPVMFIDEDGQWSVSTHYRMTMKSLSILGFKNSDILSHYSSVYADSPSLFILGINNALGDGFSYPQSRRFGIDYSNTKRSQETDYDPISSTGFNYNVWHSMRSNKEAKLHEQGKKGGISEKDAMLRGQKLGWALIFGSARIGKLGSFKKNDIGIKMFGQGAHGLQDAYAHKGIEFAKHDHLNDVYGDTSEAENVTNSVIFVHSVISGDMKSANKILGKKGSISLDLDGASGTDIIELQSKLKKSGKKLKYNWKTKKYDVN